MNEFEDALRDLLRREEPPAGFAGRVLRRVADGDRRAARRPAPRRHAGWSLAGWAAAAAVVAALAGGIQYHAAMAAREERAKGQAAKEQVVEALRLAGAKLQVVQAKIKGIGS